MGDGEGFRSPTKWARLVAAYTMERLEGRKRLGWLCVVTLVFSCSTTMTGRKQLTLFSDSRMDEMGATAFTDIKKQGKVDASPATNRYVKCVALAVIKVIPKDRAIQGRWEVVVFEDSTPNAFALPGGKIGVHTGMLKIAGTPGQLAAVLGHEVGHVLLRHGNERMSQSVAAESVLAAGGLALGELSPAAQEAVVGGLGVGAQYGVLLPFSRKHESEADQVGQTLMARAGFDPTESVKLWQNMAKSSDGQPAQWQSTHPAHETRIKDLRAQLPESRKLYRQARASGKRPKCVRSSTSDARRRRSTTTTSRRRRSAQ